VEVEQAVMYSAGADLLLWAHERRMGRRTGIYKVNAPAAQPSVLSRVEVF
jgi:hypothetical protein